MAVLLSECGERPATRYSLQTLLVPLDAAVLQGREIILALVLSEIRSINNICILRHLRVLFYMKLAYLYPSKRVNVTVG